MIKYQQRRVSHADKTFTDFALFRIPAQQLQLTDIDQQDDATKLADIADLCLYKAHSRQIEQPTIVTYSLLNPDRPTGALFPELDHRTAEGEILYSANSFINYTVQTLFANGWVRYSAPDWEINIPAGYCYPAGEAVLAYLTGRERIYVKSEQEGTLDFSEIKMVYGQDLVPVERCGRLSRVNELLRPQLVFNTAYFLLERDDIFHHHSALGEGHSFWMVDGLFKRPPLFRRGAIWQQSDKRWQVGLLGPTDLAIELPNGLLFAHASQPPDAHRIPFTLNEETGTGSVKLYSRYYGVSSSGQVLGRTPVSPGRLELTLVDQRIVGCKIGGGTTIPHNGLILSIGEDSLSSRSRTTLLQTLRENFWVSYDFVTPDLRQMRQGVQAGPILLHNREIPLTNRYLEESEQFWMSRPTPGGHHQIGVVPTGYNTNVNLNRAGRVGLGVMPDGNLIAVLATGVNSGMGIPAQDSVGATLQEMAQVLKAIGATSALNLDGGGSTQAFFDGRPAVVPGDRRGTPGQVYERMVPSVGIVG